MNAKSSRRRRFWTASGNNLAVRGCGGRSSAKATNNGLMEVGLTAEGNWEMRRWRPSHPDVNVKLHAIPSNYHATRP